MGNKAIELLWVVAVSAILVVLTYFILDESGLFGPAVLGMAAIPILVARFNKIPLTSLIPDSTFGSIDTGLLTLGAVIGALGYGVLGAIVGGVVADAITDAIAGFFEGGIAEWLRSRGIEEARTALGSAGGKMAGCLAGSGLMLSILQVLGLEIQNI
ncbi:MAG: hypothetical protein R6V10_03315 [bacterium]